MSKSFKALNDEVKESAIIKVLQRELIYNIFDLMKYSDEKITLNTCDCGAEKSYILDLGSKYKYNQKIEEFEGCGEDDEACIEDFIIYYCENCRKKEYYIQL